MASRQPAEKTIKPLGRKAYGSIPHLPGSRIGPGDHKIDAGQAAICLKSPRDKHDRVIVTEKLDGANVGVANVRGTIWALGRAGYPADTSPYEQHALFARWVVENEDRFRALLSEGECVHGEWLAQAHGTRYRLHHEPFVVFDLTRDGRRLPWVDVTTRTIAGEFETVTALSYGLPVGIDAVLAMIAESGHGAIDPVEGAVWRVERQGRVDFLAKYVRPDKVDGRYLPEVSGQPAVWNWPPGQKGERRVERGE